MVKVNNNSSNHPLLDKINKNRIKICQIGNKANKMSADWKSAHVNEKSRNKHHNPRIYDLDIHESTKIEQNQPKIDHNSKKQNENR